MPSLVVSLYAYNAEEIIKESIESVIKSNISDLEIFVVDDGSTDNTAEIINSIKDTRIKVLTNDTMRGIPCSHNMVINRSKSQYITCMDSHDMVFPESLEKIIKVFGKDEKIGQVNTYYIPVRQGMFFRREVYRKLKSDIERKKSKILYKNDIVARGFLNNGLSTYRRDVFEKIGLFNEGLKYGYEYNLALRLYRRYRVEVCPDILFARRINNYKSGSRESLNGFIRYLKRIKIADSLVSGGELSLPEVNDSKLYGHYLSISLKSNLKYLSGFISSRYLKGIYNGFRNYFEALINKLYKYAVYNISMGRMSSYILEKKKCTDSKKKIAYVMWHFPILTETFIQREIKALIDNGIDIQVFADDMEDEELLGKELDPLIELTNYINKMEDELLIKFKRMFFLKNPVGYLYLYFYVILSRYTQYKRFYLDRYTFTKAIYLAGIMNEKSINHVHSPWANNSAFIALIASKLMGISFSVQGRAYDIYNIRYSFVNKLLFQNANFIITDTSYNDSYLRSLTKLSRLNRIHVIYEGLNIQDFKKRNHNTNQGDNINILSIGRLTEQKGFIYLLKACNILKNDGYNFRCFIIGAPTNVSYFTKLKVLQKNLELENYVHFEGARSQKYVIDKYQDADLVVLPCVISRETGNRDVAPNVLIEAMAMEVPVISTNITGIPELVENGTEGILVKPEDAVSLAEAIIKLINDPELRIKMGNNGRRKVTGKFNIEKNVKGYVDLFTQI